MSFLKHQHKMHDNRRAVSRQALNGVIYEIPAWLHVTR